jgi:hypothetical protein
MMKQYRDGTNGQKSQSVSQWTNRRMKSLTAASAAKHKTTEGACRFGKGPYKSARRTLQH